MMEIIKAHNDFDSERAVACLNRGGVVAFPTETSYGLACDMTNRQAVEWVYQMKGRSFDKPLPILVAHIEMAKEYVELSPRALELAERYWPGALTLVVPLVSPPSKGEMKEGVFAVQATPSPNLSLIRERSIVLLPHQTTLALRVSSHPIAQALVERLGRPISATSANISGEKNIYDPTALIQQFKGRETGPDLILDAGILPPELPSTIVEIAGDEVKVVRQGAIRVE